MHVSEAEAEDAPEELCVSSSDQVISYLRCELSITSSEAIGTREPLSA